MPQTENLGWLLPDEEMDIDEAFFRLILSTFPSIDAEVFRIGRELVGKSSAGHLHQIEDVQGLQHVLNGLLPRDTGFTLAGLSDVEGLASAPDGYVLIKVGSAMVAMSARAALGEHSHRMLDINGLQDALATLAPLENPAFTGNATATTQTAGNNSARLATTAFVQNAIASLNDYWALQPFGVPIPVFDSISGVSGPPTSQAYRYAKLTASDAYNNGVLGSESISGSAPDLTATAVVTLADSPIRNATLPLINTDRRFLRAGSSGSREQSQNRSHSHSGTALSSGAHTHPAAATVGGNPVQTTGNGPGQPAAAGNTGSAGAHTHPLSINSDGGTEARPANIGVTYYMRIR